MHIVIAGANGFLGSNLVRHFLSAKRHRAIRLTLIGRQRPRIPEFQNVAFKCWSAIKSEGLPDDTDVVINVAGRNVLDFRNRWSSAFEQECITSRCDTASCLAQAISESARPPSTFLQISGIGAYPFGFSEQPHSDEEAFGEGYWPDFVRQWESSATLPTSCSTRLVFLRSSVVLGQGGALSSMIPFFKMYLGGPIGSGLQPFPWIHIKDFTSIYEHIIKHTSISGPVIVASPRTPSNKEFSRALSKTLRRPLFVHTPAFAIKLIYGSPRDQLLLDGNYVCPSKLLESRYRYRFPELHDALENVILPSS